MSKPWESAEGKITRERALKLSDNPNWFYFGDGHWYKKLTIFEISRRLQNIRAIRKKFFEARYDPWCKKGTEIGSFWAPTNKPHETIIFNFSDTHGYSHDWVDRKNFTDGNANKLIRMMDCKELPLLLEDPKYQNHKKVIEGLLNGSISPIALRPDLYEEYCKIEIRLKHINHLSGQYHALLRKYFAGKFSDVIYNRYGQDTLLVIRIEGQIYHLFRGRSNDLDFVDVVHHYTVGPDEKIVP